MRQYFIFGLRKMIKIKNTTQLQKKRKNGEKLDDSRAEYHEKILKKKFIYQKNLKKVTILVTQQ